MEIWARQETNSVRWSEQMYQPSCLAPPWSRMRRLGVLYFHFHTYLSKSIYHICVSSFLKRAPLMLLISSPCHLHTLILLHLLSSLSTMVSSNAYILIANLNSVLSFQSKFPADSEPLQLHHMRGPPTPATHSNTWPFHWTASSSCIWSQPQPYTFIHLFLQYLLIECLCVRQREK